MPDNFILGSKQVLFFITAGQDTDDAGALGEYPNILLLVLIDLIHIIGRLGGCTNIDLAECIVGSGIQYQTIVRT